MITDRKAFRFTFCGVAGDRDDRVILSDPDGEVHVFDLAAVVRDCGLVDSLGPRANFLLGMAWQKYHTNSYFDLVYKPWKADEMVATTQAPSTLQ